MSQKILVDKRGLEAYHKILKEDMLKVSNDLIVELTDAKGVFEQLESERQTNEQIRNTGEITRVSNERKRVEAELQRVSDESTRKEFHANSVNAENQRARSESERVASERVRISDETTRKNDETKRVSNENARKANETARVNAESSRVTAESKRVEADTNRTTKFNQEVSALNQLKSNVTETLNTKVSEVNDVVDTANSVIDSFSGQIDDINTKNIEQDKRLVDIEKKNKVQDVYIQGLFNENKDGRLTIEGEGNSLKLEGSKEGLVTIDKVVGNTFVNLLDVNDEITSNDNLEIKNGLWHINNVPNSSISNHVITFTGNDKNIVFRRLLNTMFLLKPSTTYTLIFDVISTDYTTGTVKIGNSDKFTNIDSIDVFQNVGIKKLLVTTLNDFTNAKYDFYIYFQHLLTGTIKFKMYILEGDYTDKPIPSEYFEGKQSTFEDSKVTQEMVDSGEESIENLGKYKCEVEIRGKNLLSLQDVTQTLDLTGSLSPQSGVSKGSIIYKNVDVSSFKGQHILSGDFTLDSNKYNLKVICHNIENTRNTHNDSYTYLIQENGGKEFAFNTPIDLTNYKYITITTGNIAPLVSKVYTVNVNKLQIEEGTQVTSYEPYYHTTKTVYLNSPLHKTDEIVYIDGELKHYHKMGSYLLSHNDDIRMYDNNLSNCNRYGLAMKGYKFKSNGEGCCDKIPYIQNNSDDIFHIRLDGTKPYGGLTLWLPKQYGSTVDELKTYMRDNNIEYNLILELAEPYYETIDTDRLLLEIPNNATINVKSVVPVQSMTASYTNGIPNVYGLQETNQVQDDLINISLLATDEMYMMLEPILESIPQVINNERTMSKMVDMYVAMVIRGLKTIEDVPARYREQVREILAKLEV